MVNHTHLNLLLFLLVAGVWQGQPQDATPLVTLTSVHVDRKDDALRVAITGTKPFAYSISEAEAPARIVVHIPAARFADLPTLYPVQQRGVASVQLRQQEGREQTAHLTIHLAQQTTYGVTKDRNRLILNIAYPQDPTAPADPHAISGCRGAASRGLPYRAQRCAMPVGKT